MSPKMHRDTMDTTHKPVTKSSPPSSHSSWSVARFVNSWQCRVLLVLISVSVFAFEARNIWHMTVWYSDNYVTTCNATILPDPHPYLLTISGAQGVVCNATWHETSTDKAFEYILGIRECGVNKAQYMDWLLSMRHLDAHRSETPACLQIPPSAERYAMFRNLWIIVGACLACLFAIWPLL